MLAKKRALSAACLMLALIFIFLSGCNKPQTPATEDNNTTPDNTTTPVETVTPTPVTGEDPTPEPVYENKVEEQEKVAEITDKDISIKYIWEQDTISAEYEIYINGVKRKTFSSEFFVSRDPMYSLFGEYIIFGNFPPSLVYDIKNDTFINFKDFVAAPQTLKIWEYAICGDQIAFVGSDERKDFIYEIFATNPSTKAIKKLDEYKLHESMTNAFQINMAYKDGALLYNAVIDGARGAVKQYDFTSNKASIFLDNAWMDSMSDDWGLMVYRDMPSFNDYLQHTWLYDVKSGQKIRQIDDAYQQITGTFFSGGDLLVCEYSSPDIGITVYLLDVESGGAEAGKFFVPKEATTIYAVSLVNVNGVQKLFYKYYGPDPNDPRLKKQLNIYTGYIDKAQ